MTDKRPDFLKKSFTMEDIEAFTHPGNPLIPEPDDEDEESDDR